MSLKKGWLAASAMVMLAAPAAADDLAGSDRFLCTAVTTAICPMDDNCREGTPWSLNIPQFIEVDLGRKTLSTTEASGQNRSTAIENMKRAEGQIVLQGFENGRAFSFLITEQTGRLSVAVARDEAGVVVFGACTPLPVDR
jgi:hypothetical protein